MPPLKQVLKEAKMGLSSLAEIIRKLTHVIKNAPQMRGALLVSNRLQIGF